jgi:predicted nucleic acid-binding protein
METPERVVFDTEPLVAHADDEPGSETVAEYLDATAAEGTDGYVNRVNLTEIRYILARKYDRTVADEYIDWLLGFGLHPVGVDAIWSNAAEYVLNYNPALGDSFALATAEHVEATLLVGADDDYDAVTGMSIQRFRTEPAE